MRVFCIQICVRLTLSPLQLKLDELRAVAGVTLAKRESKGDSLVTVNLTPELRQYQANKASVPRGRVKRLGQFASRRSRVK